MNEAHEPSHQDILDFDTSADDKYDTYVEQGTMSPDEARAQRLGIGLGKLTYLDKRRDLALKELTDMPDGSEKDEKIAEIYQRFPL